MMGVVVDVIIPIDVVAKCSVRLAATSSTQS
jgi:hypothetical protein